MKLICGDAIEEMKKIPGGIVDLVVTSPPYNKHSAQRKCGKTDSWQQANIGYGNFQDDLPEPKYQEQQKQVLRECVRVLKKDGSIFYNHKPRLVNHRAIFPQEWLGEFIVRQMIIWDRKSSPVLEPIRFMPTVEYIFWITKEQKTPKFNPKAFQYKEVWTLNIETNNSHPAPFPESLPYRCIEACSNEGDLVLDPYCGSGTTGLVAKELKRNFLGIDINPDYIEIAERRINNTVENLL